MIKEKNMKFDYCQIGFMAEYACGLECVYCDPSGKRKDSQTWTDTKSYNSWLSVFKKIKKPFYLLITGGEPFRNPKMTNMVNYVSEKVKNCLGIRVDTNGLHYESVKPNKSKKVSLNLSWHAHKIDLSQINKVIMDLLSKGYNIPILNFVLNEENFKAVRGWTENGEKLSNSELFDKIYDHFKYALGVKVNPQLNYNGYTHEEYAIAAKYLTRTDLEFKSGKKKVKGELFYGNMVNYSLDRYGKVSVNRSKNPKTYDVFTEGFPELDEEPIPYPDNKCFCLHSYIYFEDVINIGECRANSLQRYADNLL